MTGYTDTGLLWRGEVDNERDFSWHIDLPAASTAAAKFTINKDGKDSIFSPLQFHFHSPSEHAIEGQLKDAEVHIVHSNADGTLAVLGVLFEVSGTVENEFMQTVIDSYSSSSLNGDQIDLKDFIEGRAASAGDTAVTALDLTKFWSYDGSLTTPPCSEGVVWTVLQTV